MRVREMAAMNMQQLGRALPENYPITGICIVADPTKNPVGFDVVNIQNLIPNHGTQRIVIFKLIY